MMTTKAKRQTLKQRALAIIDNHHQYDEDTRHAVRNLLEEKSPDLAEFVRRAERGETILDLVKPLEAAPDQAASADPDTFIRQCLPGVDGLRPDAAQAMRLVNSILHPASQMEAAHALHDLLHLIGWCDETDDRHFAVLCASI